jgi:hypothetical protein
MISCYRHPSSWQRRSSFCVSCSHPHQKIGPLLLAPAPTLHPNMDEASSYLNAAWNLNGCCSREVRTGRRECPLTATTHHASPTDETANIDENGSHPAGASGKGCSDLEASPLDCSARDASRVASSAVSPLLEAQVKGEVDTREGESLDDCLDQADGKGQSPSCEPNVFVASCSNWIFTCANARSRSTCGTCAHLTHEGKAGQPSCALMLGRSGPAISCTSLTCASGRSLRFSSSNCNRGRRIHIGVTRSPTDAWTARTAAGGNSVWTNPQVSHP